MVTFNSNYSNYGAGSYGGGSSNYQAGNNNQQCSPSVSSYSPSSVNSSGCTYGYGAQWRYGVTGGYGTSGSNGTGTITDSYGTLKNLVEARQQACIEFYDIQSAYESGRVSKETFDSYQKRFQDAEDAIQSCVNNLAGPASANNNGKTVTIVSNGNTYQYICQTYLGNQFHWQTCGYF